MQASGRLLVACLCAEWCGSCRDYRATFAALTAQFGAEADFAWIDIEDESDALGDPDIENFPTLLLVDDAGLRFLGAVTPHAATAERLVRNALAGDLPVIDDAQAALGERARALVRGGTGG
ncbi:MAG: thioredoxin family protein [Burkholderiales bacterium]|nr:thioredoxin family protein [Burkholderiales bacterium]